MLRSSSEFKPARSVSLGLSNVSFHLIRISAAHSSDQLSVPAINFNARNVGNIILLCHGRTPIHDVHFAQSDFGIILGKLLERRRDHLARSTPVGVIINDGDAAAGDMIFDIDLAAMSDDLTALAAVRNKFGLLDE